MSPASHAQLLAPPAERAPLAQRLLPALAWLPRYRRGWLAGDVLAALTVWALLIPEALAYAGIAGVPPQYGLYAAPLALVAYALFGRSRHLIVGPSSTVAIVSAAVVAPLAASGDDHRYIALTIALALLAGAILVAAGLARLGIVAKFLAKPVLDGFIMGLAFTIALGQAGKFVGVHLSGETALDKAVSLLGQVTSWTWLPLLVGGGSLVLLLLLERYLSKVPAAIVAAVLATLATFLLGLQGHGLDIVGRVPGGMPGWQLTGLSLDDVYHLLPGALAVALVGYTESIAVAKAEAARLDYEVDASREMVANGLANLGAGLFQGFVVNGSLSKSAADEEAGGRTQAVSLVCAGLTLATILFLTGLFTYLPEATLGAVVIVALRKYFSPAGLVRLYRVRRPDFLLSASALAGVLVFGVLPGVAIGVVLSLALLILRESSPNSAVLGRSPHGDHFADLVTHPEYETIPGLLVYRFDGPLVFPNAERFVHEVRALVRPTEAADRTVVRDDPRHGAPGAADTLATDPATRSEAVSALVLDLEAVADMDTTAADQVTDLLAAMRRSGVRVMLARPHGSLRAFMEKDGLLAKLGADEIFPRVSEAVASFSQHGRSGSSPTT
jgi:high affinity sulfate transporter 1